MALALAYHMLQASHTNGQTQDKDESKRCMAVCCIPLLCTMPPHTYAQQRPADGIAVRRTHNNGVLHEGGSYYATEGRFPTSRAGVQGLSSGEVILSFFLALSYHHHHHHPPSLLPTTVLLIMYPLFVFLYIRVLCLITLA